MLLKQGWIVLFALLAVMPVVYAADNVTKTYKLEDLKNVVSNNSNCKTLYKDLQNLSKKPIEVQFTKSDESTFIVQDKNNQLTKHNLVIVKQKADQNMINRIVMGALEVNHKKVDYVVEVAGDLNNKSHRYVYPIILAGENARCFFTALVKPDQTTIETFKKNIQAGNVTDGKDLYTN
ncbi:MAG: hypothetical protein ACD_45C00473G0012 [uncultured bacterium]|nr:MAG: hypothetical protein ACD_45C00473G0012 [uncultured bacterium]